MVFHVAGKAAALPLEAVERIVAMAQLAHPPAMPPALEGILNLGGQPIPVLRLDRLLGLPDSPPGLYSQLVVLNDAAPYALLVDRATGAVVAPVEDLLPLSPEDSFNSCASAVVLIAGQPVHLLAPGKILLEKERHAIAALLAEENRRAQHWDLVSV